MEADFSRIGPKSAWRPRGGLILAWIRFATKGEGSGEARRQEISGGWKMEATFEDLD